MMDLETFLEKDRGGVGGEALDAPVEVFAARESQIVGVTRVVCAGGSGEAGEAAIGAIGAQVGEGW